jgi:hypothetical protein
MLIAFVKKILRFKNRKRLCVGFVLILVYLKISLNNKTFFESDADKSLLRHPSSFQKYCEEHGEWELLQTREVFIKRSAVFYFVDADILRIQMLANSCVIANPKRFILKISLLADKKVVSTFISKHEGTDVRSHETFSEYAASFIEAKLDGTNNIKNMFLNKEFDSMQLIVIDTKNGVQTKRPLDVKIKYLLGDKAKKKGVMHCGKCLHLSKKDDFADLEWWIKLHKIMGFEKKYLCDHLIEKDESFTSLFEEFKDFLEIDQLKCIPNLQDHAYLLNQIYLQSHLDLNNGENTGYEVNKYDIINILTYNECYLNNIDKYRYIEVSDTDEFVLPKRIQELNKFEKVIDFISRIDFQKEVDPFSDFTCKSEIGIESFIERDVIPQLDTKEMKHEISLHFKHGSHIHGNIIDRLFKLLEVEIHARNLTNIETISDESQFDISIEVVNGEHAKQFNLDRAFSFTIKGRKELQYALSLLRLYKKTIKPFLETNIHVIAQSMRNFDRLFFVSGDLNNHVVGKTIHNTRRTMDMFIHYSISVINIDQQTNAASILYQKKPSNNQPTEEVIPPRSLAHLSHFRKHLNFDREQSVVPFLALHFDLNYFKCYFSPFLFEKP